MKKINTSIILLLLMIFLTSCEQEQKFYSLFKNDNEFKSIFVTEFKEPFIIGDIQIIDSLILVHTFQNSHNIAICDMNGTTKNKLISVGKANNEAFWIMLNNSFKNKISSFDPNTKSLLFINNDSLLAKSDVFEVKKMNVDKTFNSSNIIPLSNEMYLLYGHSYVDKKPFMIIDSSSNALCYFGEFNINKNSVISEESFFMAIQGDINSNKNGDRFIFTSYGGNIVKFYDVSNPKNIKKIKEYIYDVPLLKSIENSDQSYIESSEEDIVGTFDVATNENFCFLLNSNVKEKDRKFPCTSNNILVFDWNGKPIKIIKTDVELKKIATFGNDSIYAISVNKAGEDILVKFKL